MKLKFIKKHPAWVSKNFYKLLSFVVEDSCVKMFVFFSISKVEQYVFYFKWVHCHGRTVGVLSQCTQWKPFVQPRGGIPP